jgi:hypothetical protein
VLLKPRELTLELGLFYARSEQQDVTLVPSSEGLLVPTLADVERDTFASVYTARLGVFRQTQLFASFALLHQTDTLAVGPFGAEQRTTQTETGDVTLGVRYTLFREGLRTPRGDPERGGPPAD